MEYLSAIVDWTVKNKEWFFSGAGIFIITILAGFFLKKNTASQSQKMGNNSKSYMAGRDMKIGIDDD